MIAVEHEQHALKLVTLTVARFQRGGAPAGRVDWDEVRGEAMLAAARALARFDPARGVKFSSYAISLIRGAVRESLRRQDHLGRATRRKVNDLERAGRPIPPHLLRPVSLADVLADAHDDTDPITAEDRLPPAPEDTARDAFARLDARALWRAVNALPARERHVLRRVYRDGWTFLEIATELRVGETRVGQLHQRALEWLREMLDPLEAYAR